MFTPTAAAAAAAAGGSGLVGLAVAGGAAVVIAAVVLAMLCAGKDKHDAVDYGQHNLGMQVSHGPQRNRPP